MLKFKPEDFDNIAFPQPYNWEIAAARAQQIFDTWLKKNGKVVYGRHSYLIWGESENQFEIGVKGQDKADQKAILINIEPLERCSHPKEKIKHVTKKMQSGEGTLTSGYMIDLTAYVCECGARVEPKEFEAIE